MAGSINRKIPSVSQIEALYTSKRFLERSEMRKALRSVMHGGIIATFSDDFIARDVDKRKRIWRIFSCARLRLKVKYAFNPAFRKKFKIAVADIVRAYRIYHSKIVQVPSPPVKPKPSNDSSKEKLQQLDELNLQISQLNTKQVEKTKQLEEKNTVLNQKTAEAKAKKAEIVSEEDKIKWVDQVQLLAEVLHEIDEFVKAPKKTSWVIFTDTTYDKSRMEEVFKRANIDTPFDYENCEQEKQAFLEQKEILEQRIAAQEERTLALQVIEKEIETLEADALKLSGELKQVSLDITKLNETKAAILVELNEVPDEQKPADVPSSEIPRQKIDPVQVLEDVLRKINASIDLDEGSEEERKITKHKQDRYLEKAVKTPNLQMSGVTDAKLSKQQMAIVVSTISNAMAKVEHNETICSMINDLIQALLAYRPGMDVDEKNKVKEFIEFVFGIDSKTKKPRLDEGMRLRLIGSIIGSVMNLTHYFHDPDSLRHAMLKLKNWEQNWFKALLGQKLGPTFVKGHINATLSLVETIEGHAAYKKHREIMSAAFAKIMIEVALGNPKEPSDLKAHMSAALKSFGTKDFKEFMDQIDVERAPDEKKVVAATVKLFGEFVKNLSAA
ncbi:MAG: hypothetical protein CK425_02405 [Parachlamydia sp.]|nr:MAG: hypothetical protein CK425_02405 [Parachlamydia sp.]